MCYPPRLHLSLLDKLARSDSIQIYLLDMMALFANIETPHCLYFPVSNI